MEIEIVFGAILLIILLVALGKWLFYKFFAPHYEARAKVVKKGFSTVNLPQRNKIGIPYMRNIYWGEFQVIATGEVLKLGMNLDLYTEIKEGQSGILTYRKGYALSMHH